MALPFIGLFAASLYTNAVITVTASPIAETERFAADGAEVVTVGADQLARLSAQDLPTALRSVPGVSISRYSPVGAYGGSQGGSVYVRGTGESRPGGSLAIFQDGAPAMGNFFSHPLMDLNPVDFCDRIEIVKSPRPRTTPNAFSAIEMTTWRQREDGWSGETDLAYGRFNTAIGSVKAGVKDGAVDAAAGTAYRHSDGKRRHGTSSLGNIFGRIGAELGETEYLTFIYRRADSQVEDPGVHGGTTPLRDRFETDMDSYLVRLESDHDWLKGRSLVYFNDGRIHWYKDHIVDGNAISPYGSVKTDWHAYGYRGLYDVKFTDFTLSLGLDEMIESGRTRTTNDKTGVVTYASGEKRDILTSPYLGAKYDFHLSDDWTLTPSAGTRYHFMSDVHGEWAPSAALSLGNDDFSVFASYARAVHYPGLVFRANTAAWRSLEAETMDTYSLGFKTAWEDFASFRLSAFRNEIEDRFDLDANGRYRNAGELKANGIEGTLRVMPEDDLSFYASATYTIPETAHASRLPEATGTLGASLKALDMFKVDLDSSYSSSMYAYTTRTSSPSDLAKVPAYWTLNARLALDLAAVSPQKGEIYLACENLLNRKYEYFPGYPMCGAMIYLGVKLRF